MFVSSNFVWDAQARRNLDCRRYQAYFKRRSPSVKMANQTLEEKMLSFSLLREGEDEDKREEHLVEEKRRQIEDEAEDEDDLPGMTKAEYHEMLREAGESYAQPCYATCTMSNHGGINSEQDRADDSRPALQPKRSAKPMTRWQSGRQAGAPARKV